MSWKPPESRWAARATDVAAPLRRSLPLPCKPAQRPGWSRIFPAVAASRSRTRFAPARRRADRCKAALRTESGSGAPGESARVRAESRPTPRAVAAHSERRAFHGRHSLAAAGEAEIGICRDDDAGVQLIW